MVAGGGPVGLSLAVELGRRGVPTLLVDQGTGTVDFTTANLVNTRTMEHLRRWGIADAVRYSGFPADHPRSYRYVTSFAGHELVGFEHPANGDPAGRSRFSPESRIWCPKTYFDPVLLDTVRGLSAVTIRLRTRVDGFTESADGVLVQLTDLESGTTEQVQVSYLAGCDGGRSGVRKQLGIGLSGRFAETANVAITVRAPLNSHRTVGPAAYYNLVGPRARGVVTSVDGRDEWRVNLWHDKNYDLSAMDTEEVCRRALPGMPFEILNARTWSGHCVVADSYGTERVFLAGDAAHLPWPAGGFGMNTGLGDAVDLGWKLAAVVDGWGGPGLLRSYEAERRPVGLRNIGYAEALHRDDTRLEIPSSLEDDTVEGASHRTELAARIKASREKEFALESPALELGYSYAGSPIVVLGDSDPAEPVSFDDAASWVQSSAPGNRAPHCVLPDGRSTLDLFGDGFTLLAFDGAWSGGFRVAAEKFGIPLRVIRWDDPELARQYERRLVLVRPDGHVAWRGDSEPPDPAAALDTVRGGGQ
nr:FAD-dependent monooxygenase [Kribbella solani]